MSARLTPAVRLRATRLALRGHRALAALLAFVLVYVSWQLVRWLPGGRQELGDLFLPPIDLAAAGAAWVASRRCAAVPRLRSFWRMMALALAVQAAGDIVQAAYDIGNTAAPFPTLADAFFLAFYVLLLRALMHVPVARGTRSARVRTALDSAVIVLGGGTAVWYFVLGPTMQEGGQGTLAMIVSVAYPVGDLILLAGLAAVLLRPSPRALRRPLLLIATALVLGIVADIVYGYGVLHGTYSGGDPIDLLYVLEFGAFALAGLAQRPLAAGAPDAVADDSTRRLAPAGWLPYVSAAIGVALLLGVEAEGAFFPNVSLALIVLVLMALVAARQGVARRELRNAQDALRASERAKDELIAVVGHELRTPLTSIRGSLGLLQGGVVGELPGEAMSMLAVALSNADRLARLVDDVLDIERMDAGRMMLKRSPVRTGELVAQALQVVQAMADAEGVQLRREVAELNVCADPDRVVQALVNLLANAVKFSPRASVVTVTVAREGACARFTVRDRGRGIPPERLQSVFERFNQVDASDAREKGGTGLGLAIAQGIVERHGGRIWVESAPGVGSAFHFTLPLARGAARAGGATIEPALEVVG
jgi:signal transduction histidine kinase